jgi:hypothetical protein
MGAICAFEGCGRRHKALGLCWGHYQQQYRGTPLRPLGPYRGPRGKLPPRLCSFEGCGRRHNGKGLCAAHRWQKKHKPKLVPVGAAKRWWYLTPKGEAAVRGWEYGTKGGDA